MPAIGAALLAVGWLPLAGAAPAVAEGTRAPGLSLTKIAIPTSVSTAGQQVTYQFVATNTGEVTLSGLTVADTDFTGTGTPPVITCPDPTLAPSDQVTCTGTYSVTQDDLDAGTAISDTATATGTTPDGTATTSSPSTATVDITAAPSLSLVKSAIPSTVTAAGQVITYSFLVINNGTVTVSGLVITETAFSGTGTPPAVTCPITTLAPEASTTCAGTYTVTSADIAAGGLTNTATATGTGADGTATTSPPSFVVVDTDISPGLALTKLADPAIVSAAGQRVTYRYVVTNSGDGILTGVLVFDSAFSGTGTPPAITCPDTTLAAGEQTTCTGTYLVTQADVDAGGVTNTATANATVPGDGSIATPPSDAALDITAAPSLSLVKSAEPTAVTAAGQQVTYSFRVLNNGNVTLTGVRVAETLFSGTGPQPAIACPATVLAPAQDMTCTSHYPVTKADLDARRISDTAVVTATDPSGGTVTSPPSTASVAVGSGSLPVTGRSLTRIVVAGLVAAGGGLVLLGTAFALNRRRTH
ncbi:hypothetical protein GCM10023322_57780 [Rugosimonospora acidiphila]|uniref:DUF7507 domain-containing protein n=1 Tax=Rugosimonospora acidiphila TaxID=556531 RepID=A0ABP9SCB1_9ACTN